MKIFRLNTLYIFLIFIFTCSKPDLNVKKELEAIDLSQIDKNTLPYKLEIIEKFGDADKEFRLPIDLNGNGMDELVQVLKVPGSSNRPSHILAKSFNPKIDKFQKNFYNELSTPTFFDINNNGQKEIFISELTPDTTYLHVINFEGKILHSFIGAINPQKSNKEWYCDIKVVGLIDVNGDNLKDMLLSVTTRHAYQPRGIFAYDFFNKKYVWKYNTGFVPQTIQILDVIGDEKPEIFMGSTAPCNGNEKVVNGTDDYHSYRTVLSSNGEFLLKKECGKEFSNVSLSIHDITGDGKAEVIYNFFRGKNPNEKSLIGIWDVGKNRISPSISIENNNSKLETFCDVNNNGKDEMLIGWDDGRLEFRDFELTSILSRKFIDFVPGTIVSYDINNDGEVEIFVSGSLKGNGIILGLTKNLQIITYLELDNSVTINPVPYHIFNKG
ncbi:hypothetical protein H8E88_23690, partial [candidate division KSB1 bacterium]|nr:hypothetical protein [candidate division KSB1 bacterium]